MDNESLQILVWNKENSESINSYSYLVSRALCKLTKNLNKEYYCKASQLDSVIGNWSGYILPLFSIVGLFINIYAIYKFNQIKQNIDQKTYLIAIAVFDIIGSSMLTWLYYFPAVGLPYVTNGKSSWIFFQKSNISCKFMQFNNDGSHGFSFFIMIFASIDSCLSIMAPSNGSTKSWKKPLCVVLIAVIWNLISCIPHILAYGLFYVDKKFLCTDKLDQNEYLYKNYTIFFHPFGVIYIWLSFMALLVILIVLQKRYDISSLIRRKNAYENSVNGEKLEMKNAIQIFILSSISLVLAFLVKCFDFAYYIEFNPLNKKVFESVSTIFEILFISHLNVHMLPLILIKCLN
uniref:GCR149 n=1 Tax=Schmidtea mediterranea TaxID=79327 RepID=A0A193KUU9_SCHMD|nr:GCR149 [Schmidtea mediterranea]